MCSSVLIDKYLTEILDHRVFQTLFIALSVRG
jgi:hypothetical protein